LKGGGVNPSEGVGVNSKNTKTSKRLGFMTPPRDFPSSYGGAAPDLIISAKMRSTLSSDCKWGVFSLQVL